MTRGSVARHGKGYLPDKMVGARGTGFHTTESRKFNVPGKKPGRLISLLMRGFVPRPEKARVIQRAVLLRVAKNSNAPVGSANREKFGRKLGSTTHPQSGMGRKMPPD